MSDIGSIRPHTGLGLNMLMRASGDTPDSWNKSDSFSKDSTDAPSRTLTTDLLSPIASSRALDMSRTGARSGGRLVTIVNGQTDDGERLFALNYAYARKQLGSDVLLIDGVAGPTDALGIPHAPLGYGLAEAIADRGRMDQAGLCVAVLGEHATDPTRLPVLSASAGLGKISTSELMEFLSIALGMFDVVVFSVGDLGRGPLLEELLPISPSVYLITTQDRAAVRASHAIVLQADPARRWRDRVTVVIDCYENGIAPTAMQITQTIGVSHSALLPADTQPAVVSGAAQAPLIVTDPNSAYSIAIFKIASTADTQRQSLKPAGGIEPQPRGLRAVRRPGASRLAGGMTLAYLAVAVPCLVGADLFFIMGKDLGIIGLPDVAWSNLIFATAFMIMTGSVAFIMLRRYFNQQGGLGDQLKSVTEHALSGIAFTDGEGTIRYANPVFRRLLNVSQSATENTRLDALLASRMGGADPRELLTAVGEGRTTIRIKSGGQQELDLTLSARRIQLGDADLGWVVNVQDTTAGRAFRESAAITTSVLEVAGDGIAVVDMAKASQPLIYVNKAFEGITGYSRMEAVGKNCRFLQGSDRMQPEIAALARAIKMRKSITVTLRNYRKDGTMFWNKVHLSPVIDPGGRTTHYISTCQDVTHERHAAEQMEQLAYFDSLTALPNRARFRRQLAELISEAGPRRVVVVRIDVRRLHDVNTTAGYDRGDGVLIEVSQRLRAQIPGALVGRINGGEFALAFAADGARPVDEFLPDLRTQLLERYDLPGVSLHIAFAIGYTVASAISADIALRQADVAVQAASTAGPNEIRPFDTATESLIRTRARMASELQQSLASDDFHLHYQPKVDLMTGAMVGAEALVRWEHPVFGLQRPDRFIPLAEQTGLVVELGALVFAKAARMAAGLHRAGHLNCPISVNVSAIQLRQADLPTIFERALADAGAEASWITLELTESMFAESSGNTIAKLQALRAIGFGLSIDDFGTGYSSLRYLKNFPVSEIKLDRGFVSVLDRDTYNRAITEAVLTISHGLGAQVVAEGIETPEEHKTLQELGCPYGQGFLFSKPLDEAQFLRLLADPMGLPWRFRFAPPPLRIPAAATSSAPGAQSLRALGSDGVVAGR